MYGYSHLDIAEFITEKNESGKLHSNSIKKHEIRWKWGNWEIEGSRPQSIKLLGSCQPAAPI